MDLNELQNIAAECRLCELCKSRNKPVFSRGDVDSDIMIVGMCPGPDENDDGRPFVGTAGKLLDILIDSTVGGTPYITNLVKCFVKPGLKLEEPWMSACLPYFINQVSLIRPKGIILLGKDVNSFLLGVSGSMGQIRKGQHEYFGIPVVSTYHPSYFGRGGGVKHKFFDKGIEDFNKIKTYLLGG